MEEKKFLPPSENKSTPERYNTRKAEYLIITKEKLVMVESIGPISNHIQTNQRRVHCTGFFSFRADIFLYKFNFLPLGHNILEKVGGRTPYYNIKGVYASSAQSSNEYKKRCVVG